jgi:tRNA U34 5-methylaminomethyl-2-thiouridine-forming methyltransferase MnmC
LGLGIWNLELGKMMITPELIITADGSHTLFLPELNESYHSRFGAVQESLHIFIRSGLMALPEDLMKINILEVGFGTGLNAILTLQFVLTNKKKIEYTAVEAYPLDKTVYEKLNYAHLPQMENVKDFFLPLHQVRDNEFTAISANFSLKKIIKKIEECELPPAHFDLVYFDAFAPLVQPELWTEAVFHKIAASMRRGAILVTYSCKGSVKRALKETGFSIVKIPGPQGKREFLRATKT